MTRTGVLTSVAIVAALATSGCASHKFVREQVGTAEAHTTRVEGTARAALDRANAAHKLAEGKFVYEVLLSDDSVKFPARGHVLSPEAQARLKELAERLKAENRNVYVEIQGHTDATESAQADALGRSRAEAVRRYLSEQGVPLNRMSTISFGKDAPVAPNDTPAGRAQNRRVVVVVLS